jgi:hypothetical protein
VRLLVEGLNPRSNISRALVVNPGTSIYLDESRVCARNLEVPAGNGVGTARAMAHAYGVFATGGRELGLRKETLDLLAAPAVPLARGFYDECLGLRAVLPWLHEAVHELALRQRALVWLAGHWRRTRLCRSGRRHRIRVRDQPDGHRIHWRSARRGAQGRTLHRPRVSSASAAGVLTGYLRCNVESSIRLPRRSSLSCCVVSSTRVAAVHTCPAGSMNQAIRSPQG